MRTLALVPAAIVALTATLALADPPQNPPPTAPGANAAPAAAKAQAKGEKADDLICEEDASVTGSILKHRVCLTRAKRDLIRDNGQKGLRNVADRIAGRSLQQATGNP